MAISPLTVCRKIKCNLPVSFGLSLFTSTKTNSMLTALKQQKLLQSLKAYRKDFLDGNITELDESGTRIMINRFLSDVLGYKQLEEIKTEYMIKGTYADYVIQVNKTRHFLVEVKALSFQLSEKHLRQTVNCQCEGLQKCSTAIEAVDMATAKARHRKAGGYCH